MNRGGFFNDRRDSNMLLIIGQRKRSNREEEVEYNCKREVIERGRSSRSEQCCGKRGSSLQRPIPKMRGPQLSN